MSRRILAIDTTGESGSIALIEDDRLLEEVRLHSPEGFAHILFDQIEQLLGRHGFVPGQIDAFASASGPGSFTGVRIGLTAVKGLAEATERKVVAVSNLQALACFGTRALRATVLDARRGEVFGAVYNAALELVCDEVVMKLPAWIATLPEGDLEIITAGFSIPGGLTTAPIHEAPGVLASAIGRIAMTELVAGRGQDPALIDANYVRRSDAELMWKE